MFNYLKLLRVKHYLKNILLFMPAFFGMQIGKADIILKLGLSFIAFSLTTSFVYIINDIKDAPRDRLHELKKTRPIAAGIISGRQAGSIAAVCLTGSLIFHFMAVGFGGNGIWSTGYLILYLALNILYSMGLKNKAIIDIFILASGFVIRLLYGAAVSGIVSSNWLILTVIMIALYMALGKRRNELLKVENGETRAVLKAYSREYLDAWLHICEAIGLVFYSLWSTEGTVAGINNYMIWTVPVVLAIVMRYDLCLTKKTYGDPIELLYNDKYLLIMAVIYVAMLYVIRYLL